MQRLLLVGLVSCALSSKAALDLAPLPTEFDGEGVKYTQLAFKDDDKQALYVLPQLWSFRGSSNQCRLTPPARFPKAEAIIDAMPLAAPQALDEKGTEAAKQQLLASLGPSAQNVKVIAEEQSPLLIGGNIATYEVTVTYQIYGEAFSRSVLFANLPDAQLRFKLTGPTKDFDALHRLFRASLISWHWVEKSAAATVAQER